MSTNRHMKTAMGSREARVYALLQRAAVEGWRCPTNAEIAANLNKAGLTKSAAAGGVPSIFRNLIRRGLITVRIYGKNWREVIILEGCHAGKKTLPPPHGGKPHVVIDPAERERRDKVERW